MEDHKSRIVSMFCELSRLLQLQAGEESQSIPRSFASGDTEEARKAFDRANAHMKTSEAVESILAGWRLACYPAVDAPNLPLNKTIRELVQEATVRAEPPYIPVINASNYPSVIVGNRKRRSYSRLGDTPRTRPVVRRFILHTLYNIGGQTNRELYARFYTEYGDQLNDDDRVVSNKKLARYEQSINEALSSLKLHKGLIEQNGKEGSAYTLTELGIAEVEREL